MAFLIGVPAVGKDKLLKDKARGVLGDNYQVADPDQIKDMLVELGEDPLAQLVKTLGATVKVEDRRKMVREHYDITQILAGYIHRESILLSYEVMRRYMQNCVIFAVQKTGTSWSGPGGLRSAVDDAASHGYDVHILMAHAHPWSIFLNQLHRVKHFRSGGRAMQLRQVIGNSQRFPEATKAMLQDVRNGDVAVAGLSMMVYGTMADVISGAQPAQDVADPGHELENLVRVWNKWGQKGVDFFFGELSSKREEYAAELAEVAGDELAEWP